MWGGDTRKFHRRGDRFKVRQGQLTCRTTDGNRRHEADTTWWTFSHGWGTSLSAEAATSCGIAPYRSERTPSFRVNVANSYGTPRLGKGGDIFTLAGEFVGSGDHGTSEIHSGNRQYAYACSRSEQTDFPGAVRTGLRGVEAVPLLRSPLTDYLAERGIPYGIASRYC